MHDKNVKENWKLPDHSSSALVVTEPKKKFTKAMVAQKSKTNKRAVDDSEEEMSDEENHTDESCDENDVENFTKGMAMLVQKFRKFNRRKGKSGFRFSKPASSGNTGKTKFFFKR